MVKGVFNGTHDDVLPCFRRDGSSQKRMGAGSLEGMFPPLIISPLIPMLTISGGRELRGGAE